MPFNERPTLLYAGDGVSDLSAATETDLLFAKAGKGMSSPHDQERIADPSDLITYCQRQGMPYTVFENWSSILATTKDILSGNKHVKKEQKE